MSNKLRITIPEAPDCISREVLYELLSQKATNLVVFDVRSPHDFAAGSIAGSRNVPYEAFLLHEAAKPLASEYAMKGPMKFVFVSSQSPDLDQLAAIMFLESARDIIGSLSLPIPHHEVAILHGGMLGWFRSFSGDLAVTENFCESRWRAVLGPPSRAPPLIVQPPPESEVPRGPALPVGRLGQTVLSELRDRAALGCPPSDWKLDPELRETMLLLLRENQTALSKTSQLTFLSILAQFDAAEVTPDEQRIVQRFWARNTLSRCKAVSPECGLLCQWIYGLRDTLSDPSVSGSAVKAVRQNHYQTLALLAGVARPGAFPLVTLCCADIPPKEEERTRPPWKTIPPEPPKKGLVIAGSFVPTPPKYLTDDVVIIKRARKEKPYLLPYNPQSLLDLQKVDRRTGCLSTRPCKGRFGIGIENSGAACDGESLRFIFNAYDISKSGWLNRNEFKERYKQFEMYGMEVSSKDIDRLFDKYDRNKDGRVCFEDFCMLMLHRFKM